VLAWRVVSVKVGALEDIMNSSALICSRWRSVCGTASIPITLLLLMGCPAYGHLAGMELSSPWAMGWSPCWPWGVGGLLAAPIAPYAPLLLLLLGTLNLLRSWETGNTRTARLSVCL
jgi:hypothetical protein